MIDSSDPKWDDQGNVLDNYKAFGVVSNPNFLGVRSRTSHIIESESLQVPPPAADSTVSKFDPVDSGSDLEEDGYFLLFLSIGSIHSVFFAEDDQIAEMDEDQDVSGEDQLDAFIAFQRGLVSIADAHFFNFLVKLDDGDDVCCFDDDDI
ncbi:hypothetical protein ACSBR1_030550 [Camellia fascicularis]